MSIRHLFAVPYRRLEIPRSITVTHRLTPSARERDHKATSASRRLNDASVPATCNVSGIAHSINNTEVVLIQLWFDE